MYILILFCVVILSNNLNAIESVAELCENRSDICMCKPNRDETLFIDVDCSFKGSSILSITHKLPRTINKLDLSKNNLTMIDRSNLLQSGHMRVLKLNKNSIANISLKTLNLPNLQELDLSENLLEYIDPEIFSDVKNLKILNLALNKFTRFETMAFHHMGYLQAIKLDYNDIGEQLRTSSLFQRNGLALTTKIRAISLKGVNLNSPPANFLSDAYDLRGLRLNKNNLTEIPELPFTLQHLDISDNPISTLDAEDFSNSLGLKQLKMNNLSLTEIPDFVFVPLKALIKLSLERNSKLVEFSRLAFGGEVLVDPDYFLLEELSLRGSRLTGLSEDLLAPFGQLIKLDLQGNPWSCYCELLWVKKLQIPEKERDHFRCYTPSNLYNSRIFDTDDAYFICAKHAYIALIAVAVAVYLAFSAFVATLISIARRPTSRGYTLRVASRNSAVCTFTKLENNTGNER